jgi:uncharacterized protein YrrD
MGTPVRSATGKTVGRVSDVLFAPQGSRVVGFVVMRPRFLLLLDRSDRHLALDSVTFDPKRLAVTSRREAWDRKAARRLGCSWSETVIWVGMPARTRRGTSMGRVRDGLFDESTGELSALGLTGGVTADVAVGVRDVSAGLVVGFDGEHVVLDDAVEDLETSGGAAAAAGRTAAIAQKAGEEAVDRVASAAKRAAAYGVSAARVAAGSTTGRKAASWLKAIKDEVVDAMGDPDDE